MEKSLRNVIQKSLEKDDYLTLTEFYDCFIGTGESISPKNEKILKLVSIVIAETKGQK